MTKRKRVKFGIAAETEPDKHDMAPSVKQGQSDTPKKFMFLMNHVKRSKQNNNQKDSDITKNNKNNNEPKSKISELKIQPQESLRDFNRRVNDTLNDEIAQTNKKLSSKAQKRKLMKQEQKEIVQELIKDENQVKDFNKLKDNIKFGDTAQEPPKLVVPKQKFKVKNPNQTAADKRIMENERLRVVEAYRKLKAKKI